MSTGKYNCLFPLFTPFPSSQTHYLRDSRDGENACFTLEEHKFGGGEGGGGAYHTAVYCLIHLQYCDSSPEEASRCVGENLTIKNFALSVIKSTCYL